MFWKYDFVYVCFDCHKSQLKNKQEPAFKRNYEGVKMRDLNKTDRK